MKHDYLLLIIGMIDTGDTGVLYAKAYPDGVEAIVQQKRLDPGGNEITFYLFDEDLIGEFVVLERNIMDEYDDDALKEDNALCYVRWTVASNNSNTNSHISTLPRRGRRNSNSSNSNYTNTSMNSNSTWGGGRKTRKARKTRKRKTKAKRKSTLRKK